jgi:hypothetical protein
LTHFPGWSLRFYVTAFITYFPFLLFTHAIFKTLQMFVSPAKLTFS